MVLPVVGIDTVLDPRCRSTFSATAAIISNPRVIWSLGASIYPANHSISTLTVSLIKVSVSFHRRGDGSLYAGQFFVSDL